MTHSSTELTQPLEFFPATVKEQSDALRIIVTSLDSYELAWISENRDFAEIERYSAKDDLDETLQASSIVRAERHRIERLFSDNDSISAARLYLDLLKQHLSNLHSHYVRGVAMSTTTNDIQQLCYFWHQVCTLGDIDNAHAMYISSDNWPFSVFNGLIDELNEYADHDLESLGSLLTGGVQDIRTSVYTAFDETYRNLNRQDFVKAIRSKCDWIRPDGMMPILSCKAATSTIETDLLPPKASELAFRFNAAIISIRAGLPASNHEQFDVVCTSYQRMYAARAAYDVYEYFGFHAFVRHLMILRTTRALEQLDPELAREFHYCASIYQYAKLMPILDQV